MEAPTISASADNMKKFVHFIYMHEAILKQYGAIKITPPTDFKRVLKKRRIKSMPPLTVQQVTQLNQNNFIYSVNMAPSVNRKKSKQLLPVDETSFWLLLASSTNKLRISSVSYQPEMSFFLRRVHHSDFNFHRLPQQSLFGLCNSNPCHRVAPSLVRAHGPGAIFPLASARQRLFSFNYHHEGGLRYWYIIPPGERKALEYVFEQQKTSICLEHGNVLIDPLMLDKHKIRYHRLVQHPDEIVVLAAGALSQSFTESAAWSETIEFALPSWLDDGHARAQISCNCKVPATSSLEIIDINSFSPELIQHYISTFLNIDIGQKSSSNIGENNMEISEASISTNISLISLDESISPIGLPSVSSSLFQDQDVDDHNQQKEINVLEENLLLETPNRFMCLTTSYEFQTSRTSAQDLHHTSSSQDFYEQMIIESSGDPRCLSIEEIMDLLATPPATVKSPRSQTDVQIDERNNEPRRMSNDSSLVSMSSSTLITQKPSTQKKRVVNNVGGTNKILCISRMRNEVTKNDIRCHFLGSTKITMKQSQLPPYHNYAFVYHKTNIEAEYNRQRPINYLLFGSDCYVDYANSQSCLFSERQTSEVWNLIVRKIPENVTEEYLRTLFIGCHSMKYTPARVIKKTKTTVISTTKNKVLWGSKYRPIRIPNKRSKAAVH